MLSDNLERVKSKSANSLLEDLIEDLIKEHVALAVRPVKHFAARPISSYNSMFPRSTGTSYDRWSELLRTPLELEQAETIRALKARVAHYKELLASDESTKVLCLHCGQPAGGDPDFCSHECARQYLY